MRTNPASPVNVVLLKKILKQNKKTNFAVIPLNNPASLSTLKGLGDPPDEGVYALRCYQRLLKIAPHYDQKLLMALLNEGLCSAMHVAAIPKPQFLKNYSSLFENDQQAINQFYENARTIKTRVLIQYMNQKQNKEVNI